MKLIAATIIFLVCTFRSAFSAFSPVVETPLGKVVGSSKTTVNGKSFDVFHNIPFAKPPVGKLRLRDPEPLESWDSEIDGTVAPVQCPNLDLFTYLVTGKSEYSKYLGQEDCLHLSIYAPSQERLTENSLPVMFFIHGGGFVFGSGSMYQGDYFMEKDIILVVINYRLGILGFLSTEDSIISGNYGLKDQTMALIWTRDNIKSFGGDPEQITIFGESAGSASVHFHILSPYSKGLYKRAILQSGTLLSNWARSKAQKSVAHQVGASLGCIVSEYVGEKQSEKLLECLQSLDAKNITENIFGFLKFIAFPLTFGPYFDGNYIPEDPWKLVKKGNHNYGDIMIGTTRDEGAFISVWMRVNDIATNGFNTDLEYFGPIALGVSFENNHNKIAQKAFEHYVGNDLQFSSQTENLFTKLFGDAHFQIGTDITAMYYTQNSKNEDNKVFFYQYDHLGQYTFGPPTTSSDNDWVVHADELFLMFPITDVTNTTSRNEEDTQMKNILIDLWTNFAIFGHPTPKQAEMDFEWEPFTKEKPNHLSLTVTPEMKEDAREEERKFWKSLMKSSKKDYQKQSKEEL